MDAELTRRTRAWIEQDPDEDDRGELTALLDADEPALTARFAAPLRFGTAGIRGPMRAGPNGINTAVVRRTAAGLAAYLGGGEVVVGHDARHRSAQFARQAAAVLAGAGLDTRLIDGRVPTPLLAFAVRSRAARAGVMITASHNPAQDNGVKVYLGDGSAGAADGAQLVPPDDAGIERAIASAGPADALPLGDPSRVSVDELSEQYLTALAAPGRSDRLLRLAYTPMHGVGRPLMDEALRRAGFPATTVVAEQAEPDPDFPTVPFPNPEEPGALDLLSALVRETGADLGLASDPDADRCAAVVAATDGTPRVLTGDEIGCLLADAVLRRRRGPVATSIVSSTLLPKMAARAGVPCHRTRTGFKWLMRAGPELVFAYEEALGYAVVPAVVRDKDGISAAVLLAEYADDLRRDGRTLLDRLDELAAAFGLHATAAVSVRLDGPDAAAALLGDLHAAPPDRLAGRAVRAVPLRVDGQELPLAEGLVLHLDPGRDTSSGQDDGGRVLLRPSGTEPKLKAYLELVRPVSGDVADVRAAVAGELDALVGAVRRLLTEPS